MTEVAPAPTAAKPAKKKAPAPNKVSPSVSELVVKAVAACKERNSLSLATVKKALAAGGYDLEKNDVRVKVAIKSLVVKRTLVQVKGVGASGSFKMSMKAEDKPKKVVKKSAPKARKPAAKKPTAATKAKTAAAKKPAAAKKSPKKVKKPAAAKATKSLKKTTKSHKKATKSPKKASAAKKAPAKKSVNPKKTTAKKK